jgi:hypothetical protein
MIVSFEMAEVGRSSSPDGGIPNLPDFGQDARMHSFQKPSLIKRAWWFFCDKIPWGPAALGCVALMICVGIYQGLSGVYKPNRQYGGNCFIEWDGRTNPIECP